MNVFAERSLPHMLRLHPHMLRETCQTVESRSHMCTMCITHITHALFVPTSLRSHSHTSHLQPPGESQPLPTQQRHRAWGLLMQTQQRLPRGATKNILVRALKRPTRCTR